jgi:hypothetical protein
MTPQFLLLDRRGLVVFTANSVDELRLKYEQWSTPAMQQGMYYTGPYQAYRVVDDLHNTTNNQRENEQ